MPESKRMESTFSADIRPGFPSGRVILRCRLGIYIRLIFEPERDAYRAFNPMNIVQVMLVAAERPQPIVPAL